MVNLPGRNARILVQSKLYGPGVTDGEAVYERMKSRGAAPWSELAPAIQEFWDRVAQARTVINERPRPQISGRRRRGR
jgi:hypothetical protein